MRAKFKNQSGAQYLLESRQDKDGTERGGYIVTRLSTGQKETVSANLIAKTINRLDSGEQIPFRGINYTVAVEQAVLFILIDEVHINPFERVYSKR